MVLPSRQLLLQYQKDWIDDKSPLKIWLKARQIGFSFTGTLGISLDCVRRKTLWLLLSASQRQSFELAQKSKDHLQAFGIVEKGASGVTMETERWGFIDGVEVTQTLLTFPNGSRQMFLPAKPETVRGFSGNVFGDEFAFHQNAKAIYASVYPSVTRGYRIELGSTPNGESGMFYELCSKENGFSKHTTDIYRAVKDGLAASVGQTDEAFLKLLRDGCPDDDIWEQEYCCKFISDASSLIPWEMIVRAETLQAKPKVWLDDMGRVVIAPDFVPTGRLYLGADIGRRKDLTALILLEKLLNGRYILRGILRLRNMPFAGQKAIITALLQNDTLGIRRLCQDASGLGMQLAEELVTRFGTSRVEGITFNMAVKEDLAVRARRVFEESNIDIPEDRLLRSAIHAVRRIPTASGHFRFDADRTDAGHADEFWALALALQAADGRIISNDFVAPAMPSSTLR